MSEYLIYAQYDLLSLTVMLILTFRTLTMSKSLTYQKLYLMMMAGSMILVGSDMVYELAEGDVIFLPTVGIYGVNILYFSMSVFISYIWFYYTQFTTGINLHSRTVVNVFVTLPAVLLIVMSFSTYYTKWVFYFDETGYHRGTLNALYMAVPLMYFLGACVVAFINALRRRDKEGWGQLRTVLAFALFPIVSVAVQNFFIGFPAICVGCMLGILQVFLYDIVRDREMLLVAQTVTKSKNNFFAGMSHEIRTPINAILGMNTMILREAENENIRGYAENVESSGKLLLTLVNDILDLSKIEAGKMKLVVGDVDVRSLIIDLYKMIEPRVNEKSLEFNLEVDPMLPSTISGDEIRIRQVILNMLTNAVKYTSEGSVTLSFKSDNRHDNETDIIVSVADTGRGMKKEDIENLFSPYERIDEKVNRKIEGTGLGMSICKQLLELMGSSMEVSSEYGKGSVFFFKIRVPVVNIRPVNEVDITKICIPDESKKKIEKYQSKFTANNARILVIDDTVVNLKVFKALLKTTGMTIDTVTSGNDALRIVKKYEYDMIFVDIMMPEMDGVETMQAMRDQDNLVKGNTPMIALTANALAGAREEYLSFGFVDYLSKPIEVEKLENIIIKYLSPDLVTYNE